MLNTNRFAMFFFAQVAFLLGLSYWFYQQNQPVALAEPPLSKLQCVSYAPYYQVGQTPLNPDTVVSRQQIEADLQALASVSNCVRTYSVNQGLDYVPAAAKKAGLTVYLGAWVGWTEQDNLKEIDLATKVANAYPNTVKGIIIGNEVLLRQEQNEATLKRYLQRARLQTKQPLTYADVWEFWLRHPSLEKEVDFVTVHILPYWEDDPVSVANGTAHAKGVMKRLKQHFKKPLFIGETGWPSAGRQRNTSTPSNVNQARYIREFVSIAATEGWQYNIIEAIDQPWKRVLEGTVGAFWGIYDNSLQAKFDLSTPVAERHDGGLPIIAAMLGAILCYSLSAYGSQAPLLRRLGTSILGASAAMIGILQWHYLGTASEHWLDSLPLLAVVIIGWGSLLTLIRHLTHPSPTTKQWLRWSTLLLLVLSLVTSVLIFHDGRYRNFPNSLFLLPAFSLALYAWLTSQPLSIGGWRIPFVAISALYAVLVLGLEHDNQSALVWAVIAVLIALANWPRTEYKLQEKN